MKPSLNIFISATEAQAWEVYTLLDTFETKDLQRYIELALNFYEEVRVSSTPHPLSTLGGHSILDTKGTHQQKTSADRFNSFPYYASKGSA